MKVHILKAHSDHEGYVILGIFTFITDAEKALEVEVSKWNRSWPAIIKMRNNPLNTDDFQIGDGFSIDTYDVK